VSSLLKISWFILLYCRMFSAYRLLFIPSLIVNIDYEINCEVWLPMRTIRGSNLARLLFLCTYLKFWWFQYGVYFANFFFTLFIYLQRFPSNFSIDLIVNMKGKWRWLCDVLFLVDHGFFIILSHSSYIKWVLMCHFLKMGIIKKCGVSFIWSKIFRAIIFKVVPF
jgi:hypothetical protein